MARRGVSVAAQTGYIEALLAALGIERAVIVGHDIGGGVAQLLALRQPGLIERLVLIDSIAWDSWPVPDIARLKEPSWDETMQRLDLSRGFRRAFERGFANKERVTDELVARYVDPFRDLEGRMAYLRAARALDPQDLLAVSDRLGSITAPTLIIWGEQDDYQLPEWGPKLAAALPNARLVTLPDAAHFVPEDAPEQTADLIARFARGE
ncbi:MAG: alpha/beta hydrolase [Chloroflexi bacterium]|nr:alpha/beta hydrolase [Chloroflexota bacterium]